MPVSEEVPYTRRCGCMRSCLESTDYMRCNCIGKDAPAWKLALAGSMGELWGDESTVRRDVLTKFGSSRVAGGIAGFVGNPGGAYF